MGESGTRLAVDEAAVLVVTSLEDVTADMVIAALNRRAVPVVRADPADIDPSAGGELTFAARIGGGGRSLGRDVAHLQSRARSVPDPLGLSSQAGPVTGSWREHQGP